MHVNEVSTAAAALATQVSAEEMMGHLRVLAGWTKHAGTPGELESLAYLREVLQTYGYATELISHDAYISLPVSASVEAGGRTLRALAQSFSRSTPPGGLTGRLVYVGRGNAADYAGLDVTGALVLIEGVAGPTQTVEAGRRGAVGQLHVSPHEYLHEMCVSPVWGSPGDDNLDQLPRTVVASITAADGAALRERCQAGQEVRVTVRAEVDTGWRPTPILVAELPSEHGDAAEPFVMFTGHHDTWHYGAMDNGGANVTMLEVARHAAAHRRQWRRGLRLIFWSGHSQGRYSSSSWYADHHWEELEARALAHVNVDSTGGQGNTVVADATAAAELGALAREALELHGEQDWAGRRMHRAGDQAFWGIGVPAIFGNMSEQPIDPSRLNAQAAVFGGGARRGNGTGWWWHTPQDTFDKIAPEILVRDTRIYLHTVWRLLTDEVLPFDFAVTGAELAARLRELAEASGGRLELAEAARRADTLAGLAGRLGELHAGQDAADADALNVVLRQLSRLVTPIDYTRGDRFSHDPALFVDGIPALADAPALAGLDQDSAEFKFLHSRLRRDANRVAVALRDAVAYLEGALAELTEGAKR